MTPGRHIDRTGHSRRPPSRVGIAPRRGCALSGRIPWPATSAGVVSSYAFDVKSRFRCTRTNSYEFVGVHNWALFCTQFRPANSRRTQKSWSERAPGRVRTCDPPLRRCPHRVRTRSSVSSQTPRPGLSPCQEPIGSGQTAHNHRALHRPGCLRQGLWLPHIPCRLGVELRTTRRAVIATLTEYLPAREQAVPVPPTALAEATAEILRRLQAIEDRLAG